MQEIKIRKVTINDLDTLQQIGEQTFRDTFVADNDPDDIQEYLEQELSVEKIGTELADENSEFYFALSGEQVIGYLKVNFGAAQTEIKDDNALEIERIYVLKEFLGKKVGKLLFDQALEIGKQRKLDFVWLGVWENNIRAIQFYRKNGFVEFDKHIFRLGKDEQTDIMMKLKINN
ncbi:GNAT family N-acetyltransferase [Salinimicrobium sp. CDJ15-81-2]|nr:GNAT family N-acetyltransferase [Salinimicrobium nanhaiense]